MRVYICLLITLMTVGVNAQRVKSITYSAGGTMEFSFKTGLVLPEVKYAVRRDTAVWQVSQNPLSVKAVYGRSLVAFDSIQRGKRGFISDMKMLNEQRRRSNVHCDYDSAGYLIKFTCMYQAKQGIYTELVWNDGNLLKSTYYECNGDSLKVVGSMEFTYGAATTKNDGRLYYPNQYLDIELFNPLLYGGLLGMPPVSIPTSYVTTVGKNVTRSRISCWHDKSGRIEHISENSYYNGFNSKETISFVYE